MLFIFLPENLSSTSSKFLEALSLIMLTLNEMLDYAGQCFFYVYVSEVYPTSIRHFAYGFFTFVS